MYYNSSRDISQRKLSEIALSETEARFRAMADTAPVYIWMAGLDKLCNWFNKSWLEFTGRTMAQEMGNGWAEGVHPEDFNRCLDYYVDHFDRHEAFKMEYRLRRHDGEYRWILDHGVPRISESGEFLGYIGSCIDITDRNLAEAALRAKDLQFRTAVETSTDGFWIVDSADTRLLEVNDAYCRLSGYSREELLTMKVTDIEVLETPEEVLEHAKEIMRAGHALFETIHRAKSGRIWNAEVSVTHSATDGGRHFVFLKDITQRKRNEAMLIAAAEEINDLYDHAPCGYHSIGADGTFLRINDTELSWLGCTRDEVIGKLRPTDFFTPASQATFAENFPKFKRDGKIDNLEFDMIGQHGKSRHVITNATAVKDAYGDFVKSRSVMFDITELQQTRDRLQHLMLEQNAMLDNELVGIAKVHNRHLVWANKAMYTLFGYDSDQPFKGISTRILYPDEAAYQALGAAAYPTIKEQGTYRSQLWLVRKDGEKIWVDISGASLLNEDGESVWMFSDISAIKAQQDKVKEIAYHDILTDLPNRLLLADRLEQALAQCERTSKLLAVCYLDLDDFKPVNDTLGHAAGDQLLKELACRMLMSVRAHDTVARVGGDEFVLLLTNLETTEEHAAVLQRVIDAINQPFQLELGEAKISASVGVTLYPIDNSNAEVLLRNADHAMYQAKNSGRNCVRQFEQDNSDQLN